jgi:hypothetical protein
MLPRQLLCPPLANPMSMWSQVPALRTPAIGVKTATAQRGEQAFEVQQRLLLTPTKAIHHPPTCLMSQRLPQPPRRFLAADKGPHVVPLSFPDLADHHRGGGSFPSSHQRGVHGGQRRRFFLRVVSTVVGRTPRTRAVSRMPLPLSAISPICCLTSGSHPVWCYGSKKIRRWQCGVLHR